MRVNGSLGVEWIECIHPVKNRWAVRWDVQPETDENGEKIGVTYEEEVFNHRPTEPEIKEKVNAWINASVDEKIFSGFVWEGYPVWLSQENQFNYKAALYNVRKGYLSPSLKCFTNSPSSSSKVTDSVIGAPMSFSVVAMLPSEAGLPHRIFVTPRMYFVILFTF